MSCPKTVAEQLTEVSGLGNKVLRMHPQGVLTPKLLTRSSALENAGDGPVHTQGEREKEGESATEGNRETERDRERDRGEVGGRKRQRY